MFSGCTRKPYIRTPGTKKHLTQYIQNTESLHMLIGTSLTSSWVSISTKVQTPQKSRDPQEDREPHPFRSHLSQQRGQHTSNNRTTNKQIQSAHSSWSFATWSCVLTNKYIPVLDLCRCFVAIKQLLLQQGSENRDHTPLSSQNNVQGEK